jgi:hypothetical protein
LASINLSRYVDNCFQYDSETALAEAGHTGLQDPPISANVRFSMVEGTAAVSLVMCLSILSRVREWHLTRSSLAKSCLETDVVKLRMANSIPNETVNLF